MRVSNRVYEKKTRTLDLEINFTLIATSDCDKIHEKEMVYQTIVRQNINSDHP